MIHTLSSITIFISLFLAFYLLTTKSTNKISNSLFSIFLVLTAIDTSGVILDEMSSKPLNISILRSTFSFLQIPVFYLYVRSVCYSDFKLKPSHLIHGIPFLLVNAIFLPRFYLVDIQGKLLFLENNKSVFELQFTHILFHLQFIGYIVMIFLLLKKVKNIYLENYSGLEIKMYDWLLKFTIALSLIYIIALFKNIIKFSDYTETASFFKIGIHLMTFFLVCWYLYKALQYPEILGKINAKLEPLKKKATKEIAAELKAEEQLLIERLHEYMQREKPFLNSSLTIQNVSDNIEIPVRELSLLINHKLNQHFYEFINSYRIKHAMHLLSDESKKKMTVLEILYDSGFNSKSSFNTAFKKETGLTPTRYRKNLLAS